MKSKKHTHVSPGMEEKMQNERENRRYSLKGDFSAILETRILFPSLN